MRQTTWRHCRSERARNLSVCATDVLEPRVRQAAVRVCHEEDGRGATATHGVLEERRRPPEGTLGELLPPLARVVGP